MTTPPLHCALCGASDIAHRETVMIDGTVYDLYRCGSCSAEWWEPFRNPGASWYEHDERYADRNQDPILLPNGKHTGVVSYFGARTGRVLDVGCGTGNFLAYAESRGWEGWGIDFDQDAVRAGKEALGLARLEVADINGFIASHPHERFDLITFFDVLEHLDDPTGFMESLETLLVEGGHIAFSVPYRHGWRWLLPHDLPPRHLTRWDETSISSFLKRHGYTLTRFVRTPASLRFLIMKLRFRYGAWASFGLVRKIKERAVPIGTTTVSLAAPSSRVRFIHMLAKVKDTFLFGLPAFLIWLVLLPTRKRYTDCYVIAQKDPAASAN